MTHGDHIRIDVLTSSQEIVVTIGVLLVMYLMLGRGEAASGAQLRVARRRKSHIQVQILVVLKK